MKEKKDKIKKTRRIVVLLFFILAIIIGYVLFRGRYLEALEIGENYISVFWKNVQYKSIIILITFFVVYISMYITHKRIAKGLKSFFDDEKREMPKLLNKSISFIIAIIISSITCNLAIEKTILFFNSTTFGITDGVFGYDMGYYLFQKPFIEFILMYSLILLIGITIYSGIYFIIAINTNFEGVKSETLKNSEIVKQLLNNTKIFSIILALITFIRTQDISSQKFLNIGDGELYSLYGAGFTDINIKIWGYRLLSIIIVISVFLAISAYNKKKTKNVIKSILIVPTYLILLGITMFGYNYLFIESNELEKQREYIQYNINNTKNAYNINIEEIEIENGGTIDDKIIQKNTELLNNISIMNEEIVLKYLNGTLTNKGYYKYTTSQIGNYNINGKDNLVYISPREILNTSSSYDNKTYEYTHGYGAVISSASRTTNLGTLEILQKSIQNDNSNIIKISNPRIYFGMETNETVVTNSKTKQEFDYISTDNTNIVTTNIYDGKAGLQLSLFDRMVLALSQGDLKLITTQDIDNESKILINRNIISRAKTIMPYLIYDNNPYMVIDSDGNLIWVLDAYTTSEYYPYSQKTDKNNMELNYIRNSVKVLINAYDGTTEFYITDRTDPIIMAYRKAYPNMFKDLDEEIPADISSKFVYPKLLYSIQANILKRYHNVQYDVLYRAADIWDFATYNNGISSDAIQMQIDPYYTMLKTVDYNGNRLGLVIPFTLYNKQNILAYLVGGYNNGYPELKLYKFPVDSNVLGTMQLDTQIEQNEAIYKQIKSLDVTGTKITKNTVIIPINDVLLYVESIYQQYINEADSLPVLKKVVVASGNKVAIGEDIKSALINLASQSAIDIEIENTEDIDELIKLIIKANKNLDESTGNSDWEMMGKDLSRLQGLINKLETAINLEKNKEKDE